MVLFLPSLVEDTDLLVLFPPLPFACTGRCTRGDSEFSFPLVKDGSECRLTNPFSASSSVDLGVPCALSLAFADSRSPSPSSLAFLASLIFLGGFGEGSVTVNSSTSILESVVRSEESTTTCSRTSVSVKDFGTSKGGGCTFSISVSDFSEATVADAETFLKFRFTLSSSDWGSCDDSV
nr:hypothetical protein Iba_chr02bCG1110 [Ipomoea batatas]GMC73497.1 hypothetical protein Iba_scaffold34020CG0520 [Ipomoea batatas]